MSDNLAMMFRRGRCFERKKRRRADAQRRRLMIPQILTEPDILVNLPAYVPWERNGSGWTNEVYKFERVGRVPDASVQARHSRCVVAVKAAEVMPQC